MFFFFGITVDSEEVQSKYTSPKWSIGIYQTFSSEFQELKHNKRADGV